MSYAKLDLKFELPIWIQENEHSLTVVNPGGAVSEIPYEEDWLPFRYVEATNEAFGKLYRECGTGKPVRVKRQTFRNLTQFYGDERKIDSFVKNIILYEPHKIKELGKEGKLRILCFDFEMFTDGKFPDPERDPIIAYGVFRMDQSYEDPLNSNVRFKIDKKNEKALIKSFIDEVISYDPDVVAGYFSTDFDLPYLYKRMKKYGIKLDVLNRVESSVEEDFGFFYSKDGTLILSKAGRSLGLGRIHDDIFLNSVKKDDFLRTKRVKNRRLKTVAAAYGLEGIYDLTEGEKTSLGSINNSDLERYIISDLRCTAHLCSRYIGTTLSLSRMLVWPLDMTINRSSGKVADIFAGQRAFEQGWLSLRQSKFRFAKLFETIATSAKGKFEGAYNWASEPSIFPQISKTDVTSMYPSIMIQFNLSPDSLSLLNVVDINNRDGVEPVGNLDPDLVIGYKQIQYNIDGKQITKDWYSIPDRNMRKRLIIEVDRKPGFVVSFLTDLMSMRKEVKDNLKKAQSELEVASLDSKQNSIKILLNSCYGAMGNEHFYHTSLPIAIFVTAIGREITGYIHDCFRADVVEIDTDGLIFKDITINADIVNEKISGFLLRKYKKKECYIAVKDEYGTENRVSMLLSKKKNYCIYEDGEVEPVGNTFTSSRFPPFIGKIIKDTAKTLIQETINGNDCRDILDNIRINAINGLYSGSLDQFKLSLNIHKSVSEYKSLGKPSSRLNVFISNERLSPEEKIEQIKDYFKETVIPNVSASIANTLSKMLSKLDPHKLEKSSSELIQYCVGSLDTKINSSMSQAVKVLDKYFERHGAYPLVGESVEYYYCADSGEVDITENLKSITQVAIKHYRKIIESVMDIFAETIQNRNNSKGSEEDGLFG